MTLNKDGTIRKHLPVYIPGVQTGEWCKGSGQYPRQSEIDKAILEEKEFIQRHEEYLKRREEKLLLLRKARQSKEWQEARKKYLKDKCEWCGSNKALTVHHFDSDSYKSIDDYKNIDDGKVITLCKRCHFALHKGMELCPICKTYYKKPYYPTCYRCSHLTTAPGDKGQRPVKLQSDNSGPCA